jgi:hypothetical protein
MEFEDFFRRKNEKGQRYSTEERKNLKRLILLSLCFAGLGVLCGMIVLIFLT